MARSGWCEARGAAGARLRQRFDAHAARHRIRFTVNDVRCHPQSALLGELDERDHVGAGKLWVERVVIHRVGEHRAVAGHRPRGQWTATVAAFAGSGMDPLCAPVTMRDAKLRRRLGRHGQYSTLNSFELMSSGLV
jgi:hypothetical protein